MEEQKSEYEPLLDGIYFDLDEDEYHSIRRLSSSGIQSVMVSPATFWERSWLNPNLRDITEDQRSARLIGRAYHCARLEPESFDKRYVRDIDIADFKRENMARTGTDIKEALGALGQAKTKAGEAVIDAAHRLREAGFDGVIWPLEVEAFNAKLDAMEPRPRTIAPETYDEMVRDMGRIHANPAIHKLLSGGAAEVSVLWTCPRGNRWKARFDYLRPDGWSDFKTFANPAGKPLRKALNDAFQFNRYFVQGAIYRDAFLAAKTIPVVQINTDQQRALIKALQENPRDPVCHFVFQEKNGVPNILARQYEFHYVDISVRAQHAGASDEAIARVEKAARQPTLIYQRALFDIRRAVAQFETYYDVYKPSEPWFPLESIETFADSDFNKYWLSGEFE